MTPPTTQQPTRKGKQLVDSGNKLNPAYSPRSAAARRAEFGENDYKHGGRVHVDYLHALTVSREENQEPTSGGRPEALSPWTPSHAADDAANALNGFERLPGDVVQDKIPSFLAYWDSASLASASRGIHGLLVSHGVFSLTRTLMPHMATVQTLNQQTLRLSTAGPGRDRVAETAALLHQSLDSPIDGYQLALLRIASTKDDLVSSQGQWTPAMRSLLGQDYGAEHAEGALRCDAWLKMVEAGNAAALPRDEVMATLDQLGEDEAVTIPLASALENATNNPTPETAAHLVTQLEAMRSALLARALVAHLTRHGITPNAPRAW
jgi:hypothetical protein